MATENTSSKAIEIAQATTDDDAAAGDNTAPVEESAAGESAPQPATEGELHTSTGADGHGADHGNDVFPPLDSTTFASQLVWLAITFGVFYYLMSKVILPRIAQTLEQRHDRIASDLAEAEKLKSDTDEAIAAYEQALAEARQKANDIAKTTRERVQQTIDSERADAEDSLNTKLDEANARIADIKAKALKEVDGAASDAAQAIIDTVGGVKATKAELTKAVSAARS